MKKAANYGIIVVKDQENIITKFNSIPDDCYSVSGFDEHMETISSCEYVIKYINNIHKRMKRLASTIGWGEPEKSQNDNVLITNKYNNSAHDPDFLTSINPFVSKFVSIQYYPDDEQALGFIFEGTRKDPEKDTYIEGYEKARGYDVAGQLEEKVEEINIEWDDFVRDVEAEYTIKEI